MIEHEPIKILQINTVYPYGSTGKIARGIHDSCDAQGLKCLVAYRYREKGQCETADTLVASSWSDCHVHNRLSKYTLLQGCYSYFSTRRFLRKVREYSPDVIQLHNLHGSYINLKLLFSYIKKNSISVVWTLHDCWAFTGYCPHFVMSKCNKWKTGCASCEHYKPVIPLNNDVVSWDWRKKREWFTGVEDLTLVTPSKWLAGLVKESFMKDYPVKVINNGIDLDIFKPIESDFCQKYHCEDKKIILGVSMGWSIKKGLDIFVELASRLPENYQIVLVGGNEQTERQLPSNVISIHKTQNQQELAEIYTVADVFVNPTREDTFPTVNIESLACGTPVITFRTGGSPEIMDETCGSVVDCDDVDALEKEIVRVCTEKPYKREECVKRAQRFDQVERFEEYVKLYEDCAHRT